jgi:polysaccharide pyruvyl transferase WcaK-like protein
VGRGNLGDEATLAAVIREARLRAPEAEIRVLTMNPADTRERHGVTAIPLRRGTPKVPVRPHEVGDAASPRGGGPSRLANRLKAAPLAGPILRRLRGAGRSCVEAVAEVGFLAASSRHLKGVDLLIVAGGGQLGDYFEGIWGYPFTILKWTLLARARGARVAFLSVGAGPIQAPLSRRFLRLALESASYRSFRDVGSRELIESIGVAGENHVYPDLVHGFAPAGWATARPDEIRVVGINPLPFHDSRYWAQDGPEVYGDYVRKLAAFATRLIETGYRVVLFPTQVRADPPVIEDVRGRIAEALPASALEALSTPRVGGFDELADAIRQADVVVASRFHGIILSLEMGKPVIGLSYNPKTDELMAAMGLGEYVADMGRFDLAWLSSRFEAMCQAHRELRRRIQAQRESYRESLEEQYGRVFGDAPQREPRLVATRPGAGIA